MDTLRPVRGALDVCGDDCTSDFATERCSACPGELTESEGARFVSRLARVPVDLRVDTYAS